MSTCACSPKIAIVDIENAPNLAYVWEKYEQDVLSFEREWNMMSFAYKWRGEKKVHCYALPDFPRYKKDPHDDSQLVAKLWEVFDEADIIVWHNGDRFDRRKSNARYLFNRLRPPSPYRTVDTLKEARRLFKFNSNRLGDLATHLGVGSKVKHEGFPLWLKCMRGDMLAWARMKKYNTGDITINERVYEKLLPWIQGSEPIGLTKKHRALLA